VFLTAQLRSHLATSLIKAAVLNANISRIIYVDYDAQYEGHRFCEEGVIEPEPIRTHGSSKSKYAFGGSSDTATDYYPEGPSFYEEIAQAKHPDWTASSL
jgi:hypothetical protein